MSDMQQLLSLLLGNVYTTNHANATVVHRYHLLCQRHYGTLGTTYRLCQHHYGTLGTTNYCANVTMVH